MIHAVWNERQTDVVRHRELERSLDKLNQRPTSEERVSQEPLRHLLESAIDLLPQSYSIVFVMRGQRA
jgi:hypothetical protein